MRLNLQKAFKQFFSIIMECINQTILKSWKTLLNFTSLLELLHPPHTIAVHDGADDLCKVGWRILFAAGCNKGSIYRRSHDEYARNHSSEDHQILCGWTQKSPIIAACFRCDCCPNGRGPVPIMRMYLIWQFFHFLLCSQVLGTYIMKSY